MKPLLAEFIAGLREPSRLSLAVLLLTFAGTVAAYLLLVTPALMRADGAGFALGGRDYFVFAGVNALKLSEPAPGNELAIAVVGASATRAVIDEARLPRLFDAQSPPAIFNMCTDGQKTLESLAYLRTIHPQRQGYIILAVNLASMWTDQERRSWARAFLPFDSDWLEQELLAHQLPPKWSTGLYALDHLAFFMPRVHRFIWARLSGRLPEYVANPYVESEPLPQWRLERQKEIYSKGILEQLEAYDEGYALIEAYLEELPTLTPHMQPLLLISPINPWFIDASNLGALQEQHYQRLRAIADKHAVPLLDLSRKSVYGREDYRDWIHIRGRAAVDRGNRMIQQALQAAEGRRGQ